MHDKANPQLEPASIIDPIDPWKHRANHMRCKTCMWFTLKEPSRSIGRCRRHAPTMNGYPVVFVSDWCGDHKLNEHSLTT